MIASTHRAHGHTLAKGTPPERGHGGALRQGRGLQPRLRRLDAPLRRRARQPRRERGRRRRAPGHRRRARSPSRCEASPASRSRSSETAPRTSARSTRRSTSRSSGRCRPSSSARTTTTPSRRRCEAAAADRGPDEAGRGVRDDFDGGRRPGRRGGLQDDAARRSSTRATGEGPVFLLAETYRLTGHYVGDPQVYRPKEEIREAPQTQDPIDQAPRAARALRRGVGEMDAEATRIAAESVEFAKKRHRPEARRRPEECVCLVLVLLG